MAVPTIPKGEEYFFPIVYEGNGAGRRVGKFVPFDDSSGGTIANSVLYNDNDNPYLTRTQESGSGNQKRKATFSWWFKRGGSFGTEMIHFGAAPSTRLLARFDTSNRLVFRLTNGTTEYQKVTNRTFEDTSKWFHCVWAIDVSQSTATDRSKVWIDGDQIASWSSDSNPAQNTDVVGLADGTTQRIGCASHFVGQIFDGYLAEFNYIDNQALTPASFGVTDTSTGRWIPKTVSPYPTTTTDIAVTVVSSGGNKYALDGVTQGTVTLIEGATYKFDQSDSSNSGHPLRFSTTSDGTHGGGSEFTSGVTTVGTPGSSGAYTQITVPTGTATLYYYCSVHSGMGGTANTQDQYGTNGFRLQFQDSSALGDDTSGNTNDFTSSGLTTTDQTTDSPTQNFPTFDSNQTIDNAGGTNIFSEGNLRVDMDYGGSGNQFGMALMNPAYAVTSGKYYWEHKLISQSHTNPSIYNLSMPGIIDLNKDKEITSYIGHTSGPTTYSWYTLGGFVFCDGTYDTQPYLPGGSTLPAIGDIINFALDMDNGAWYIGVNGTYVTGADGSVGNPASGSARTGAVRTFAPNTRKYIYGTSTQSGFNCVDEVNFGQKSFTHSIPTGYTKWQQDNLPETDRGITGMSWVKNRDSASWYHTIIDSSRGALQELYPNGDFDEAGQVNSLRKFLKGGYQCGEAGNWNSSGNSMVSWNWVCNGGITETNTDGDTTVTLQKNTTAGFSIGTFTSTVAAQTCGHGLGATPEVIILKRRDGSQNWMVYHKQIDLTDAHYMHLNNTDAEQTGSDFGNTLPTSTVFTTNVTGTAGRSYCFWAWTSVDGFSKFGKYSGNGNDDGQFVYTGFTPAWIMVKRKDSSGYNWQVWDTQRSPINPITNQTLFPDGTFAEGGTHKLDILSNGFKWRSSENWVNASGGTYIYMAFAKNPFVGDGTSPVTAR